VFTSPNVTIVLPESHGIRTIAATYPTNRLIVSTGRTKGQDRAPYPMLQQGTYQLSEGLNAQRDSTRVGFAALLDVSAAVALNSYGAMRTIWPTDGMSSTMANNM
jgi:hypothetical protein